MTARAWPRLPVTPAGPGVTSYQLGGATKHPPSQRHQPAHHDSRGGQTTSPLCRADRIAQRRTLMQVLLLSS
ncbi:hypothetical protein BST61_g1325 [Cercospora zeina]